LVDIIMALILKNSSMVGYLGRPWTCRFRRRESMTLSDCVATKLTRSLTKRRQSSLVLSSAVKRECKSGRQRFVSLDPKLSIFTFWGNFVHYEFVKTISADVLNSLISDEHSRQDPRIQDYSCGATSIYQ
jgi:hypothetical protein